MSIVIEQIELISATLDEHKLTLRKMNDYDAFQKAVIGLQEQVGNLEQTTNTGQHGTTNPLVDRKELTVYPFDGDKTKSKDFLKSVRTYMKMRKPKLADATEWLETQPKNLNADVAGCRTRMHVPWP